MRLASPSVLHLLLRLPGLLAGQRLEAPFWNHLNRPCLYTKSISCWASGFRSNLSLYHRLWWKNLRHWCPIWRYYWLFCLPAAELPLWYRHLHLSLSRDWRISSIWRTETIARYQTNYTPLYPSWLAGLPRQALWMSLWSVTTSTAVA